LILHEIEEEKKIARISDEKEKKQNFASLSNQG
jgi:hypothetical protein